MAVGKNTLGDIVKEQLVKKQDEQSKVSPVLSQQEDLPNTPTQVVEGTDASVVNNAATNVEKTPLPLQAETLQLKAPASEASARIANTPLVHPDDMVKPVEQANRYAEAPDLKSIVDMINQDVEDKKARVDNTRKLSSIPLLMDLANLFVDGAMVKANGRVDKREGATSKHNANVQRLQDLYEQTKGARPQKLAQLAMQDFQNRLNVENRNLQREQQKINKGLAEQRLQLQQEQVARQQAKDAFDQEYKKLLVAGKNKDLALKEANQKSLNAYRSAMAQNAKERVNVSKAALDHKKSQPGKKGKTLEFLDPATNSMIEIPENRWKANFPQLLNIATKGDEGYKAMVNTLTQMGDLSSSIMETLAKDYILKSPEAMTIMKQLAGEGTSDELVDNADDDLADEEEYNTGGLY